MTGRLRTTLLTATIALASAAMATATLLGIRVLTAAAPTQRQATVTRPNTTPIPAQLLPAPQPGPLLLPAHPPEPLPG